MSSAHLNALLAKFTLGNLGEVHEQCGVVRHQETSSTNSQNQNGGTQIYQLG
jgi:hypothetical protein